MPRTVVITGASAGVGRAVAREFAHEGANVGLIARDPERLEDAADEVRALGGNAIALPCDVADAAAVERAAVETERAFGPIDVWVNSAMVTVLAPVEDTTAEEFRRVTEVTYLGVVHGTQSALKRMRYQKWGTIIQVGSALAYRSIPLQAAYCAAKHAIVGFTDSLRSELIHQGANVAVTMVHLPAVNTPQFDWARNKMPGRAQPVPPVFQPEVAAEAIHFASLHPRREVWVGGSTYQAILGQQVMAGYLDRMLAGTWDGQQTQERAEVRADNLFEPVKGPYAAHGRFDDQASDFSPALWATEHRRTTGAAVGLALAAAGAGLAAVMMRRR
ncbi:SDR family oxidoreductase [Lutibaculum baratangense]|uniref:Dehydrogenase n=1 Tax=Lutibaculum baratangense AMV1 TaxID=631454 RepID=V4R3S8_9HYPH|nr:SDR family oxidoreductase [Lutibaculum baratangense]ESR26607.1 dehydrogenase [Lutibaculum baratangense AMV1]